MKHNRIAAAAALLITAAFAQSAGAQRGDFRWNGRLSSGQEIEIRNLNGDIRAEPSSGSEVEVVGRRSGDDVEDVEIRVVPDRGGVTICAVFPSTGESRSRSRGRNDDRDDQCSHGRRHVNKRNFDARVDFVVRVPAGVELVARTVSGDIEARGLRGTVDASSVSGDVDVSTSGRAEASSVSGNVRATLGRTGNESLRFNSVSGNVVIRLPAGIDADFRANTLSGRIESDFPINLRSREERRSRWVDVRIGERATGTFGRGGPEISAETVSGNIRVERVR